MSEVGKNNLELFLLQAKELSRRVSEECRERCAIMFTDITASTSFFERHGDFDGLLLLHEYNQLMSPIIEQHGGTIIKTLGDGLLVSFPDSAHASSAAIQMQQSTLRPNSVATGPISITIAIHAGDIFKYKNDVFGDVINAAARVSGLTNSGTILLTGAAKGEIETGTFVTSFATRAILKGKAEPVDLFHLHWHPSELARLSKNTTHENISAFISTVTPHSDAQVRFVEAFSRRLFTVGIEPVFLKQSSYDKNDPIGKVASQIEKCDLVIILGLERSHAYYLKDKEMSRH